MPTRFRTVADTNVILSSYTNPSESSPNLEYLQRWRNEEFDLLYSIDTLREYVRKLGLDHSFVQTFFGSTALRGGFFRWFNRRHVDRHYHQMGGVMIKAVN